MLLQRFPRAARRIRGTPLPGDGLVRDNHFHRPPGTHYLSCETAFIFASPATLEATVTAGGRTYPLGTIARDNKLMRPRCFPVPFTLDAASEATLTLRCTAGASDNTKGTVVDDLALVPFNDDIVGDNLVANGDFENGSTGWSTSGGTRLYSESAGTFGSDPSGGLRFLNLARGYKAWQSVGFPGADRYQLRFRYRSWNNSFAMAPVAAYLAKDGATNWLGRAGVVNGVKYTGHVDQTADFDIEDAGTYSFGLLTLETAEGTTPQAILDDVEIRRVSDRFDNAVAVCDGKLELSVADGAHVVLDFNGIQTIGDLRLGGRSVSGLVGSATHPKWFSGPGVLEIKPKATVIVLR